MLADLDESLKQLLVQRVPLDPAQVAVSFDTPDREWAAALTGPTVNLFMYDVRENLELRGTPYWLAPQRQEGRGERRRPPVRLDLSYVVTAWTASVEDEHQLLGRLLVTLLRYPVLPPDVLQGGLQGVEEPIPTRVVQPDGGPNPADLWNAVGNRLKAGLMYQVTVPVDLEVAVSAPLVFTRRLRTRPTGGAPDGEAFAFGGVVRRAGRPQEAVAGAAVTLVERGLTVTSDAEGRFRFGNVPQGRYTLRVAAAGQEAVEATVQVPSPGYEVEV